MSGEGRGWGRTSLRVKVCWDELWLGVRWRHMKREGGREEEEEEVEVCIVSLERKLCLERRLGLRWRLDTLSRRV